jgi:hypothetical protein
MKTNQALNVRTGMQAGKHGFPNDNGAGNYPGQTGWWWVPGGYIARPGRPMKAFTGWYYGPAPTFYYPGGSYGGGGGDMLGAPAGGDPGDGTMAPPAP